MSKHILNIRDVEYRDPKKVSALGQFPSETDGKPTVMRFIIKGEAEMADYWEGE
jgi:hypothetical protein